MYLAFPFGLFLGADELFIGPLWLVKCHTQRAQGIMTFNLQRKCCRFTREIEFCVVSHQPVYMYPHSRFRASVRDLCAAVT